MSRTDKHRPYWVRLADTPLRTSQAHHDHRSGPCTLPGEVTPASTRSAHGTCYWTFGPELYGVRLDSCGAEATRWAAEANHRDRRETRRLLRHYRGRIRPA
ncbi:hypothetical protein KIH74_13080 [Kineosporia sp. J2-2]|uniref:Uncharacterized protein n=1 Tax=Kineosporia corallincola TaxID=2835133 RepID=A0ABS5TFK1_9ACTN|nr:hypothetical protein [Kineosporia corallincola]MBT0769864.1 hypothetical protein [Kineosporia corallincola]